jgi:hypothetical protein
MIESILSQTLHNARYNDQVPQQELNSRSSMTHESDIIYLNYLKSITAFVCRHLKSNPWESRPICEIKYLQTLTIDEKLNAITLVTQACCRQ